MNKEITEDLIKFVKNEYIKDWQRNNKDKVKQAQDKYWKKKAQEYLNSQK